ncbi:hypothetical protein [Mesoterricola silvestris]|uniref:Uncharacterized protein n=1 Tax=Mesoterricola silvestris TaxID=2927979 RepID=A0AA48H720_9BACT|nr:hypothetical protein [Mesoterricola silvestris]BDU72993.1 hypothetical protein METEAL_21670 [Mesoterricola silvestris]
MWLSLLERQGTRVGWDELVTGHDFGLLTREEIQDWLLAHGPLGPLGLAALEAGDRFEAALWEASREATGKVPRPGGRRWAAAQDRWRLALLKDAMDAPLGAEALALAVEAIYEKVGCPEDMLGLWKRGCPWERKVPVADRSAIERFMQDRNGVGIPS